MIYRGKFLHFRKPIRICVIKKNNALAPEQLPCLSLKQKAGLP